MSDIVDRLRLLVPSDSSGAAFDGVNEITRLTAEVERLRSLTVVQESLIRKSEAANEKLRAALREAYEVYAGSDGFIPETAGEGYQQQIIRQMVNCISAALEEKQ